MSSSVSKLVLQGSGFHSMPPKGKVGGSQKAMAKQGAKRSLRRRDTEECVARIVQVHFASWSHHDVHATMRAGESLTQRLLRLKREKAMGERISAATIADLRREYEPAHTPLKKLRVEVPDQEVEPGFKRVLLACDQSNPAKKASARSELVCLLGGKMEVNQREVVALLRLCSTMNPQTSVGVRHFLLEVAKFLARTHAIDRYPRDIGLLRATWDATFAAEYAHARSSGMLRTRFYEAYADALRCLGSTRDMERLVYFRGAWTSEKATLKKVTSSSLVGQRMFAHDWESTLLDDFSEQVQRKLAEFDHDVVSTEKIKLSKDRVYR